MNTFYIGWSYLFISCYGYASLLSILYVGVCIGVGCCYTTLPILLWQLLLQLLLQLHLQQLFFPTIWNTLLTIGGYSIGIALFTVD